MLYSLVGVFGEKPTKLKILQINWDFSFDQNQRFAKNKELVGVICNVETNKNEILIDLLD